MSRMEHDKVMKVLAQALELDEAQRPGFIETACAGDPELRKEVEQLLACDDRAREAFDGADRTMRDAHPSSIGSYHLLNLIGEGGMGVVWRAQQRRPIERIVALKLIKLGMNSKEIVARFESERQALALMDHPNVARVFDAGAAENGRPYFVMEYVAGEPILAYCNRRRLNAAERLKLFIPVCEAVQHAHTKGLIHRDLKPSNILVSETDGPPVPKVIDFGVAKAISRRLTDSTLFTERGELIGTPEYMSPEQAEMGALDVDTRTDIYSLGVVLYALLTGMLPFDAQELRRGGQAHVQKTLRELDPPRPSTRLYTFHGDAQAIAHQRGTDPHSLIRQLRRELEWIPLKAMRKDPMHRYRSAAEMADDLRNYLSGLPLLAAPESGWYRARKLLRRHRGPGIAAAAVAVALLAGTVIASWQAVRAKRAERAALEQQRQAVAAHRTAQAVNDFFTQEVIGSADPAVMRGRELSVREALDNAARNVPEKFRQEPATEAAVRSSLAMSYESLGRADLALPHIERAQQQYEQAYGQDHADTVGAMSNHAVILNSLGRFGEAEGLLRQVLEWRRRVLGPDNPDTIAALNNYATSIYLLGRIADAEPLLKEVYEHHRRLRGEDHPRTLGSLNNYAIALRTLGRYTEGVPLLKQALEQRRRLFGEDHPETLRQLANYADLLLVAGRSQEALPLAKSALEQRRRVMGEDHPDTIASLNLYASVLTALDRSADAEPLSREVLERRRRTVGPDHPDTIAALHNYAITIASLDRYDESLPLFQQALEQARRVLGSLHPDTLQLLHGYAEVLDHLHRFDEAERLHAEIFRLAPEAQIPPVAAARYMAGYGVCLLKLSRHEEAMQPLLEAYRRLEQIPRQDQSTMRDVVGALATACDRRGDSAQAARWRAELARLEATTRPSDQPASQSPPIKLR